MSLKDQLQPIVPLFLLSLLFIYSFFSNGYFIPGFGLDALGRMMQIEWLVFLSGMFLVFAVFLPLRGKFAGRIRFSIFTIILIPIMIAVFDMDGARGVLGFVWLCYATWGGTNLLKDSDPLSSEAALSSVVRYTVSLFVFFPLLVAFDLGGRIESWDHRQAVIPFGALYFSILTGIELLIYLPIRKKLFTKIENGRFKR
jgi:hypothetical protein